MSFNLLTAQKDRNAQMSYFPPFLSIREEEDLFKCLPWDNLIWLPRAYSMCYGLFKANETVLMFLLSMCDLVQACLCVMEWVVYMIFEMNSMNSATVLDLF